MESGGGGIPPPPISKTKQTNKIIGQRLSPICLVFSEKYRTFCTVVEHHGPTVGSREKSLPPYSQDKIISTASVKVVFPESLINNTSIKIIAQIVEGAHFFAKPGDVLGRLVFVRARRKVQSRPIQGQCFFLFFVFLWYFQYTL